jgi:hypothetical protein
VTAKDRNEISVVSIKRILEYKTGKASPYDTKRKPNKYRIEEAAQLKDTSIGGSNKKNK